ncbi:hypothetical protein SCHPADRAFT_897144, partial [Schizopora paradoxa]
IFCPTRAPNLQAPVAADLATVSLRRSAIGIAEDETPRIARRGNIGVYRKMQRKTDRNGVGDGHTILLKIFEVALIALTCIGLVIYADQLYEVLELLLFGATDSGENHLHGEIIFYIAMWDLYTQICLKEIVDEKRKEQRCPCTSHDSF